LLRKLRDQLNKIKRLITTHHRPQSCKISKEEADGLVAAVTNRVNSLTNGVPDGLSEEEKRLVDDVQAFCLQFQLFTELNGRTLYGTKWYFGPTEYVSNSIWEQALRAKLPRQSEMGKEFDDELMLRREWRRIRSLIAKLERDVKNGDASAQGLLDRTKAEHNERVRRLTEARKAVEAAGEKGKVNAQRHLDKVEAKISKEMLKAAWKKHNESVHGRTYSLNDPEYTAKCQAEVESEDTSVPEECRIKHIPTETLDFVRHGPISDIWKHWNSCVDAFQTAKDVHGEDASSKKIYVLRPREAVDLVHGLRRSGKMP
jgi:hypothetical protein